MIRKELYRICITKDFVFFFASGRHYFEILEICNYCKITAFMITSNGAKIYNLDKKLIFTSNIDKDVIANLLRYIDLDTDIIMHMYCNEKWYIHKKNIEKYYYNYRSSSQYQVSDFYFFKMDNVSKIFFTSNYFSKLFLLKEKIIDLFKSDLDWVFSSKTCLEIMSKKVSKGNALTFLMKYLNSSLTDCIAFGNAMNDMDMLKIVGKACIMVNSDLELKKQLPYAEIVLSNDNDGVARYLEVFLKKSVLS
ncbi:HAD-IIB family hydrolase [Buchnera aphidicola]|uniref:HAD-IIB family hydrolase n=1 Tax=Buchnera aphidicola TaxID=9 RepID=UPI002AA2AF83|nr:HAD-IIB family hydrolase [Buchnera aphidicola]